ncbi:MAG TPA: PEP/pyruvate-binding domain-containing protein [Anaerolineales bacterium]|nr:PEP/pyruvate-binding domain-containing protein [Anaerolineales bacterium]
MTLPLILSLQSTEATLETVGGKGASLSTLSRSGFPVPDGFMISTAAYRDFVEANNMQRLILSRLVGLSTDDPAVLQGASSDIRGWFLAENLRPELIASILEAYTGLGGGPVAVRSSATAEDLPEMSFAGQQETFLNIVGGPMLYEAIVNCWSSLWTARAIGYRSRNGIPHNEVALSVLVQIMVQSEASGVLFTANPLTGKRSETVIDATFGLGEALVSGLVEPDHYVVDTSSGEIIHKTLGSKALTIRGKAGGGVITEDANAAERQAIPDDAISDLTELGQRVSALYQSPQDIEWAWGEGQLHLLQSRPITSLFPIPEVPADQFHVFASFAVIQGLLAPFTPLGQDVMKMVFAGGARIFGFDLTEESQRVLFSAGERLWVDITPALRNSFGRKILSGVLPAVAPGVAQTIDLLLDDPRLAPGRGGIRFSTFRRLAGFFLPSMKRVIRLWRAPERERERITRQMDEAVRQANTRSAVIGDTGEVLSNRLEILYDARVIFPEFVIPQGIPPIIAGMIPFFGIMRSFSAQAAEALGKPAFAQAYLEIARGLPHNVTTEMDLALWRVAQAILADSDSLILFQETSASDLAAGYLKSNLPSAAQESVASFLERYGARGIGEIDIGLPRWGEDPTHIMRVLQSYLQITDPDKAPDVVFARAAKSAEQAAAHLESTIRQMHGGFIKSRLLHWAISRYRALAGMREAPKFFAIRMMNIIRQGLLQSGQELFEANLLEQPDDLFFLTVRELGELTDAMGMSADRPTPALKTSNLPALAQEFQIRIAERRVKYQREQLRKQIPRILLSDGTTYYEGVRAPEGQEGAIIGDPVSPGEVEGTARVIFDPQSSQLAPGEILVCPGTDPAWTPLFLTASGLVMEVGGMMTHGSVVAREFGIPAVVGVHQATERIKTGQRLRVNGSTGEITLIDDVEQYDEFTRAAVDA